MDSQRLPVPSRRAPQAQGLRAVVRSLAVGCVIALGLTGCQGSSGSASGPSARASASPTEVPVVRSDSAPPGIDTTVLHDFTDSGSGRMLGLWEDTVVTTITDANGTSTLTGWSTETGRRTWRKEVVPELGSPANSSESTVTLEYDAVSVFEVWRKDRLDRLAHLTLLDPSTGLTRSSVAIPAFKSEGAVPPFGVAVKPWDNRYVIHLPDGRTVRMPSTKEHWIVATPRGAQPWVGFGDAWPAVEAYERGLGVESVSWTRALRRHDAGGGRLGMQLIDSVGRKNLVDGCLDKTLDVGNLVVSPHRTWAAWGNVSVDLTSGEMFCNPDLWVRAGQALAINDAGRMFGFSGTVGVNATYWLSEPDGAVQTLSAGDGRSTFEPPQDDPYSTDRTSGTVAMTDTALVVAGRMFALPSGS